MVKLADAVDDLLVSVRRSVGVLLASQRKNDARTIMARSGELVRLLARSDFEPRSLAPKIDAGGGFDHIRNVSAANARRNLNEIEFPIGVSLQELRVGHPADQAKALD